MIDTSTDRLLEEWGNRLLRGRRHFKSDGLPIGGRLGASTVRREVRAIVRRAPQVMVKVTGGGRGMRGIKAHMAYISRGGALEVEDQEGNRYKGRETINELAREWRHAGTHIPEKSNRREAFNVILSMPRGAEPIVVKAAAREVMRNEFKGHRLAMVLHEHQENPHVHVVVRAERDDGRRLNPRKPDLHRWRERFAAALRSYGIEAAATRQVVRGVDRRPDRRWEIAARSAGRLHRERAPKTWQGVDRARSEVFQNWRQLEQALSKSPDPKDRELADEVRRFIVETPAFAREVRRMPAHQQFQNRQQREVEWEKRGYERGREITGPER
jgi:hypothetical protein